MLGLCVALGFLVAQTVKNSPAVWETWVRSLGWEHALERGHGTPLQCSCLENPHAQRSLRSTGSRRVGHDYAQHTAHALSKSRGSLLGGSCVLTAKIDQGTVSRTEDALPSWCFSPAPSSHSRAEQFFFILQPLCIFIKCRKTQAGMRTVFPPLCFLCGPRRNLSLWSSPRLPRHVLWFSQTRCGPAPVSVNEVYRHKATST